jgi:predicted TPR repeat methyltransferase
VTLSRAPERPLSAPEALRGLATELYRRGQPEEALKVYEQLLAIDPENPVAIHMLAACTGENTPDRASDRYVRQVFDAMAPTFDEHLCELAYCAPALVAEALAQALGEPDGHLTVLDAGCGTGLCGPWLRPFASTLIGVDLSPGMLSRAGERGDYDRLVEAELTRYLEQSQGTFDVIVAADTLVYFGSLEHVLRAAYEALREGGCLSFTVECLDDPLDDQSSQLGPSGRYAHGPGYVHAVLEGAGFADSQLDPVRLRLERGVPVGGLLISARRSGPLGRQRRHRRDVGRAPSPGRTRQGNAQVQAPASAAGGSARDWNRSTRAAGRLR